MENGNAMNGYEKLPVQNGDSNIEVVKINGHVNGDIAGRPKKTARRVAEYLKNKDPLIKSASLNGVHHHPGAAKKLLKNSRKPRNGFGRGQPKKGGAGGKGVWGKPGLELNDETLDEQDPNYDSDSLDNGDVQLKTIVPDLSKEDVQKLVEPILQEYFQHADSNEVIMSLEELALGMNRYLVPLLAMEISMDHKPSHRELASVLISDMCERVTTERDNERALSEMVDSLSDLVVDVPEAAIMLGKFMARAVADDCLAPKFIQSYKGKVDSAEARNALAHADTLLSMKHGLARLDTVWGVGGGARPVKWLRKKMALLLEEYISSGDVTEAARCVTELEVPHFHHELVYEAVVMVIEKVSAKAEEQMCKFLKSLYSAVVITPDQMNNGFLRVFEDMPDIVLDVPVAYTVLDRFVNRCQAAGLIDNDLVNKMPSRGRKRFVSEGDGGRIKDASYNGY